MAAFMRMLSNCSVESIASMAARAAARCDAVASWARAGAPAMRPTAASASIPRRIISLRTMKALSPSVCRSVEDGSLPNRSGVYQVTWLAPGAGRDVPPEACPCMALFGAVRKPPRAQPRQRQSAPRVSIPASPARIAIVAKPRNRPCSTTPGMA
ncbi:MAG: hypothetical protein EOP19_31035 [Hyphomicrobiales bacterium]|nr:MAG: hypothetical protein EOP19_31035 [Hyphomicrobiales bacterium]